MSFGISAAAWTAIAVGTSVAVQADSASKQRKAQKKAQKKADEDAVKTSLQNRRSEIFAETEGSGIGQLGQISLAIDEEEDDVENVLSI